MTTKTKSAIASKINWKSMIVIGIVSGLSFLGVNITETMESNILLTLVAASEFVTVILRTYFSGSTITGYFTTATK
jgi:hypothetical protein